jgi:putative SOS response-associated peptidase YedK
MNIEILSAVRRPHHSDTSPAPGSAWPPRAGVAASAWVEPGDQVCVYLLTLHGARDHVDLPWGQINAATDELEFLALAETKSFARACLIPASEVRQACDAEGIAGSVVYKPKYAGSLAGFWVPADPHLYQPSAFKLLMAPAGPDLAPYCSRQPIFIASDEAADWLNPRVNTSRFQQSSPVGTFTILEVGNGPLVPA